MSAHGNDFPSAATSALVGAEKEGKGVRRGVRGRWEDRKVEGWTPVTAKSCMRTYRVGPKK